MLFNPNAQRVFRGPKLDCTLSCV